MRQAGIIIGSTIQMNYESFGFYAVGTVSFQVEANTADQATDYIRKIPNIAGAWRMGKTSSIIVVATLKNVEELDRFRDTIKKMPSAHGLITNVWTGIRNIPENLSITPLAKKAQTEGTSFKKLSTGDRKRKNEIDEIDNKIVEKLSQNGRLSFKEIAEAINSSTSTVARKYEKLRREGIIKVTVQINPLKLGYHATAWFSIVTAQNNILSIVEKIANIPDVTLILKISGEYDLSVTAMIKDIEHLLSVQDEITCIEGVTKVETIVGRVFEMMPLPREYISTF